MGNINKGEIGQPLRVNLGEDISTATSTIIFAEPEVGKVKEFEAVVPLVPVTVGGVTLNAGEYAEYITLTEEDMDYIGRWRMKLKATFASDDIRQTDYVKFRVLA